MSTFQDNLRQYRNKLGINAKDFAAEIGIKYSTYASYENLGREPKYDTLIRIATALSISIDDLLGYTAPREHQRLVEYARSCGLIVNEKDGLVYVDVPASAKEGLTPGEQASLMRANIKPVTINDFDNAVSAAREITEDRFRVLALLEIVNSLDFTLMVIDSTTITSSPRNNKKSTTKSPTE